MIRINRFEKKIVVIIVAVTAAPLIAALVLGQGVLRENYRLGLNERVLLQLKSNIDLSRDYLETLRDYAEHALLCVEQDSRVRAALQTEDAEAIEHAMVEALAAFPQTLSVSATHKSGLKVQRTFRRVNYEVRKKTLKSSVDGWALAVTVAIPQHLFDDFRKAGEFTRDYDVLVRGTYFVSNRYLAVYLILMLLVIFLALVFGIPAARKVTRRVGLLVAATKQVASGDMQVQVPISGRDEVADLTRSFNDMVRELGDSRARIDYLQRISAWQGVARRLAHEIKNPLTPILLAVQEVHRAYPGTNDEYHQKLDQACQIVKEEVSTLRHLVTEFSEFAKLPKAHLQPGEFRAFLEETVASLRYEWELEHADMPDLPATRLELSVREPRIRVSFDPMLMRRCLINLCVNAKQAMQHSGVAEPKVDLRCWKKDNKAFVEVKDNGPGVSEEYQARIFDPYFTTKHDGTGLGLAIVKTVILEHNGRVEYVPSEFGGASFVIQLPLDQA
ncbi:MAG: HAMP domain-containing protein [Myxococcales bacterium]|nr:MAG: HAMP domain-containing protein [Myxococcales bacterium]